MGAGHDPAVSGRDGHGAGHGHGMLGMAAGATLHCLTGCSIGEIGRLLVGTTASRANLPTTVLSIALAIIFGYSLSALPLVRGGNVLSAARGLVLAADTLSIVTMEIVDNLVMLVIPGAMNAGLLIPVFWVPMAIALIVASFAARPVNRTLSRRGKGHAVTHHAPGEGATLDHRHQRLPAGWVHRVHRDPAVLTRNARPLP